MKKIPALLFILALLIALPVSAQQSRFQMEDIIRIEKQDTLDNNVMLSGQTVEVMGVLTNDLFSASRHFLLNGQVADDAFITAQMVSVNGSVGGMLMSAGETILIDGNIEGDLVTAGRNVRIADRATITGNAYVAGGTVTVEGGTIGGKLSVAGGEIRLNGDVQNAVDIYGDDVVFGDRYRTQFSTTIHSSEPINREMLGNPPADLVIDLEEPDYWGIIFIQFWLFISVLVTGLILIRLFEQTAIDLSRFSTEHFWKNTGIGLLSIIGVPLAIAILAILLITIPLSVLLALTFTLSLFAGYILVAITLGVMSILMFKEEVQAADYYWGFGLGMIYIAILTNLPFIGGLLNVLLLLFGLGSLAHYSWRLSRTDRPVGGYQPSEETVA